MLTENAFDRVSRMDRPSSIRIGTLIIVLALAIAAPGCKNGKAATTNPTLRDAENTYASLDLEVARGQFSGVLEDLNAPTEDRAEAARRLSTIAWRFDKSPVRARTFLERARSLDLQQTDLFFEEARLFLDAGDFPEARRSARQALNTATTSADNARARVAFARAVFEEVMALPPATRPSDELAAELREARDSMRQLVKKEPGLLEASRLLLGVALMGGDGPSALAGWRSYYLILPGNEEVPLLDTAEAILARELPNWSTSPAAHTAHRDVIRALADSGFFDIAAWIAESSGPSGDDSRGVDADVRAIVAYAHFLKQVQRAADESYRLTALDVGSRRNIRSEFDGAARELWPDLGWIGETPSFSRSRFLDEIGARFGALVKFEPHDGAICLHLGLKLIDREFSVTQYSKSARLRFKGLDSMISNGYNSWFWDGTAGAGGWVDEAGSIVQVRPAYAEGPIRAWRLLASEEDRKIFQEALVEERAGDDAIARDNPYAFLPGLARRLRQRGYERILDELENRDFDDADLRAAFTRELARRQHASSILAHEGRHAIDKRTPLSFLRSHAEKEYRAKLSEVVLAPDPGLALTGGIFMGNIGSDSSHGQANERIVKDLVAWMRQHEGRVEGFDRSRPHLPQLDLLSDDQLRDALREVDPLAQ